MASSDADTRAFQVVVAATKDDMGIGFEGSLPWRLPKDMAYFKAVTSQVHEPGARNAVVRPRILLLLATATNVIRTPVS